MAEDFWLSIGLGAGLGAAYGAAGYLTNRKAAGAGPNRAVVLLFGGMLARMSAGLVLLLVILAAAPVQAAALVGSFGAVFLVALVLEILSLVRK